MGCSCAEKHESCCSTIDLELLDPYLEQYGGSSAKGNLIAILQKTQDIYGYLPAEALGHISVRMGIKPSKIMGVVSFFTQFRTKPIGKNLILLCQGTACHVNGSPVIEQSIKDSLGVEEGDISADGLFTYTNVACIGCCSLAPVMMIGNKAYGKLTKDRTAGILREIAEQEVADE